MTDRDPVPPRRPSPTDDAPTTDAGRTPSATRPGIASDATPLKDRWWWSPTLAIVVGAVVIGYQLEALRGPDPLWLNWVVAALGLVAAVYGVVTLLRAYRSR